MTKPTLVFFFLVLVSWNWIFVMTSFSPWLSGSPPWLETYSSINQSFHIHDIPIYLSIYLSIYPSIYLSIYPHIYLSIYLSMHLFLYSLPMCLFIWLSKSIDRLINESLNLSDGACTWKGFFCPIKEMFSSDKILQQRWSPHVSYS